MVKEIKPEPVPDQQRGYTSPPPPRQPISNPPAPPITPAKPNK